MFDIARPNSRFHRIAIHKLAAVSFVGCLLSGFFVSAADVSAKLFPTDIPYAHAFKGWNSQSAFVTQITDFSRINIASINCQDKQLYPSHPQQSLKEYHLSYWGGFDQFKLDGDDSACMVRSNFRSPKGHFMCLAADFVNFVVISDLYQDSCGHLYRGYKRVVYFHREENMGTLFSPGRTAFQRAKSVIPFDFIDGNTYAVPESEFLFLGELATNDEINVARLRKEAEQTHDYDSQMHVYLPLAE